MPKKPKPSVDLSVMDSVVPSLDERLKKIRSATGNQASKWGLENASAIPGKEPEKFKRRVYSSGLLSVDQASRIGGFPRGHIVELYGSPSAGKSLLLYNQIREVQRHCSSCGGRINQTTDKCLGCSSTGTGGLYVLFDQENTFDPAWAARQEVDLDRLLVLKLPTGEQATDMIRMIMNQHKPDAIGIDSIAQLQPQTEQSRSEVDDSKMMGLHAKVMATLCRHMCSSFLEDPQGAPLITWINQLRADVSGNGAIKTTGGYAPEHYSSIRLYMLRRAAVNQQKPEQGVTGRITFKKCKAAEGVVNRTVDYVLLDQGFDRATDTYETAVNSGIFLSPAIQSGGHYWAEDTSKTDKLANNKGAMIELLRTDEGLHQEVRDRVLATMTRGPVADVYLGDFQEGMAQEEREEQQ